MSIAPRVGGPSRCVLLTGLVVLAIGCAAQPPRTAEPPPAALRHFLTWPKGSVLSARFSPDGRLLAVRDLDGGARLWDPHSGRLITELTGHTGGVRQVVCSPDGRFVASRGDDQIIRLWSSAGVELAHLAGHRGRINHITFAADGHTLVSAGDDGSVRLWSLSTLLLRRTGTGDPPQVQAARTVQHERRTLPDNAPRIAWLSPDGQTLVSRSEYRGRTTTSFWSAATARKVFDLAEPRPNRLVFSPSGSLLATASSGSVQLWQMPARRHSQRLAAHQAELDRMVFSPTGRLLATSSRDRSVRLWDTATGKEFLKLEKQGTLSKDSFWNPIAFSPDGRFFASVAGDGSVQVVDLVRPEAPPMTLRAGTPPIWSARFAPGSRTLVTRDARQTTLLWDLATGKPLFRKTHDVLRIRYSPTGELLAHSFSGGPMDVGHLHLVDAATGRELISIAGFEFVFSPDGEMLAVWGGAKPRIELWRMRPRFAPRRPPHAKP